jgi:D-amino-acid dehydrogenase
MKRILVIGGGVVGVATANALARSGLPVTLLEQSVTLGHGATHRNGAQLSYAYSDALGSPSVLRSLPELLCGFDPAFRAHLSFDPRFWNWLGSFLANCTAARFKANTLAVLRLALQSRASLAALRARHGDLAFDHSRRGKLHIYDDKPKFEAARAGMTLKNAFGLEQRALSAEEAIAVEPALAWTRRKIAGAIHSPIDEAGDAYLFTQSLATIAAREHQLQILTGQRAQCFITEGSRIRAVATPSGLIEAEIFVLAAGCDSPALARTAGVRLPIFPMKGYSATLPASSSSPRLSITDARAKIVFCTLNGRVRIAGMADLGRNDVTVEPDRIRQLIADAKFCLPNAANWDADPHFWAGIRPMTSDSRPIISPTSVANLFINSGHGMLGWTLACGSADLIAALITGANPSMAADFSLGRF